MDGAGLEFRLLGPFEARVAGRPVEVGAARQRCVLAVLLLDANRGVPTDVIVERVWEGRRMPARPRNTVQLYVSLLRTALAGIDEVALVRSRGGYLLEVDERQVDIHRFHGLIAEARAAGTEAHATALLERALGLWRGEALGTLDTPWFANIRTDLRQQRVLAERDLTDLHLRQGRHDLVLPRLSAWIREHPLDERLAGQLMLALFRAGRPAQALEHYRDLRHRLTEELGTDPAPPLQRLHRQILAADPALAAPAPTATTPPVPVPRQLPAPPRLFTRRTAELAQLDGALDERSAMVIATIAGIGGVGKTWLALHWANRHLHRFPDGQLHVNLRGFDTTGQPVSPATALRGFLDALGVPPAVMPADLDTRAGLYRSLVAGRRMLILLDNARDAGQVTPLLPGSPTCTVVVTSRNQLRGLVATHGATPVSVDVLPDGDARQLLVRHLGDDRVAAEPEAVTALLGACAGLPLALGIVAARASHHREFPLAMLAAELSNRSHRLDALDPGDPQVTPRAVLSWSRGALSGAAATAFALLGSVPAADLALPAAASLFGRPTATAQALLHELEHASLVQQHAPGRYRMHELVRLYAAEVAARDLPDEAEAALRRWCGFCLHTAFAAARVMFPTRPPVRLEPLPAGAAPSPIEDADAAYAWLRAEHPGLLACQLWAADRGWHGAVWQLAWALDDFHLRGAHFEDMFAAWRAGLAAAHHEDDPVIHALAHRRFGDACSRLGRHADAVEHLARSLRLAGDCADTFGRASTHQALASEWAQRGDREQALGHALEALRLFTAMDMPSGRGRAHSQVGWFAALLGRYALAREHCEAALALCREHADASCEADTLDTMGYVTHHTNRDADAVDFYRRAVALYRGMGNGRNEADTLERLGHVHAAAGQHAGARDAWREALHLYRAQRRIAEATRVQRRLAVLDPLATSPAR